MRYNAVLQNIAILSLAVSLQACSGGDANEQGNAADTSAANNTANTTQANNTPPAAPAHPGADTMTPNELGRIPVLEYHLIGDKNARWERERGQFRKDLELI